MHSYTSKLFLHLAPVRLHSNWLKTHMVFINTCCSHQHWLCIIVLFYNHPYSFKMRHDLSFYILPGKVVRHDCVRRGDVDAGWAPNPLKLSPTWTSCLNNRPQFIRPAWFIVLSFQRTDVLFGSSWWRPTGKQGTAGPRCWRASTVRMPGSRTRCRESSPWRGSRERSVSDPDPPRRTLHAAKTVFFFFFYKLNGRKHLNKNIIPMIVFAPLHD